MITRNQSVFWDAARARGFPGKFAFNDEPSLDYRSCKLVSALLVDQAYPGVGCNDWRNMDRLSLFKGCIKGSAIKINWSALGFISGRVIIEFMNVARPARKRAARRLPCA